ncbi:acyltransferase family protein [Clostridium hydrogenum]|uniref:acyltransferase family protein n=1 Tax=Clostridium hydrogenum TaxID=2855764 RepID=UPI001F213F6D|nr:acyltransferase family protein [Clostridium hydrogenum]
MQNKRIEWIDVAKGIAMLLVILGHTSIPNSNLKLILSFHMPLFFFLSGYTFKLKGNFLTYLKKKIKSLLIPYFVFSVLTYIFWVVVERRIMKNSIGINIFKPMLGIFYANNIHNYMIFDGVLWFIPCLFVTEMLFYFISRFVRGKLGLLVVLLAFIFIGFIDSKYMVYMLPWGIDIAFTAIIFYGFGYIVNGLKYNFVNAKILTKIIVAIISSLLLIYTSEANTVVYMYNNEYGKYFYFLISAFSGIMVCVLLANIINKSTILSYIGANSFIILALHPKTLELLKLIFNKIFKINTNTSLLWGCIFTIFSLLIIMPFIYIINKYFSFILGKQKTMQQDLKQ